MHFVVNLMDRDDGLPTRIEHRPAHIEWLKGSGIPIAGPFLDSTGEKMIGTMYVVEAEDEAAVRALLAQDPFAKVGLFKSVDIKPWRWTIGNPA
jgi:uncharacterized protein YciI